MSTLIGFRTNASILVKRLTFSLTFYFFELVTNCLTDFLFVLLLGTIFDPSLSRIYSKQKSKYHKFPKKGLRPVSFLEPLWICFNNIFDFVFRDCFVPRYIDSNMAMVKLDSMEDFFSLPLTSWNIRQPAGSSASSKFFFKKLSLPSTFFLKCFHHNCLGVSCHDTLICYLTKFNDNFIVRA